MHFLIDGYNLMHAAGLMKPRFGPGGLEKARRALIGLLAGSLGDDAGHATVVFDAPGTHPSADSDLDSGTTTHGIHVQFAGGEDGADALIEKLIQVESAPKQLAVVSTDHRIRAAAKRRGARPVDSEAFLGELVALRRRHQRGKPVSPAERPTTQATADSEFWLRQFEDLIDEDDLRELAGPFG